MKRITERYNGKLWGGTIATRVERLSDDVHYRLWYYKEFNEHGPNVSIAIIRPCDDGFQITWERSRKTEVLDYDTLCSQLDAKIKEIIIDLE